MANKEFISTFNKKIKSYRTIHHKAKEWFEKHFDILKIIFENNNIRDFVFEPFKDVFKFKKNTKNKDIYIVITQVAIINAILAGLPGQMGVGVYVSMALEGWMAYTIAKHVGIKLKKPSDIFNYFSLLSGVSITIVFIFKHIISLLYSIFSIIPMINPLIIAELLTTDLVGILFWIGFEEVNKKGKFSIPYTTLKSFFLRLKELFKFQSQTLKNSLNIENLKLVAIRFKQWLNGDLIVEQKILNGELFATAAMAYLLEGKYEKLSGPLGDIFLEAIRLRWSAQLGEDATIDEIAKHFSKYSPEALNGAINTIKGKMFEIMVTNIENSDNDNWIAVMHDDESYPGSDIIFTNTQTGQSLEISLKATSEGNISYIEHSLQKYPNIPIITTDEIAKVFENDPRIFNSGIKNSQLEEITKDNIDTLINSIEVNSSSIVINGVSVNTFAAIWPFAMAYFKGRINYNQFENALIKIIGDSGIKLASRLAYAFAFGPIFAWYLLARGVKLATKGIIEEQSKKVIVKI